MQRMAWGMKTDALHIGLMDYVRLNRQVVINKLGGEGTVRQNTAHLRGCQENVFRLMCSASRNCFSWDPLASIRGNHRSR